MAAMTLSRRMAINLTALVLAVAAVGAAGVWALIGLQRQIDRALADHERLRQTQEAFIYDVGMPILMARRTLMQRGDPAAALDPLRQAAIKLDAMDLPRVDASLAEPVAEAQRALRRVIGRLARDPSPEERTVIAADLNTAFSVAAELSGRMQRTLGGLQADVQRRTRRTAAAIAVAGTLFVLVAILVGVVQHRAVLAPIRRIGRGVERFGAGRFDERLDAAGGDELAGLARQFNHMADELSSLYGDLEQRVRRTSRRLAQSERLASVGHLAAGVAHEINNPLAIIAGHAELLLRQMDDDDARRTPLGLIRDEAFRCKRITEKLLALSRDVPARREPADLRPTVRDVVAMAAALPRWAGRTVDVNLPETPLVACADPAQIRQVLLNLLTNAAAATGSTGRITVRGGLEGGRVVLSVTDEGKGMDEATLARIFEPFYTERRGTNEPGTGLGLSISHAIIADHGGELLAHSDGPGRGSTLTISLPAAR